MKQKQTNVNNNWLNLSQKARLLFGTIAVLMQSTWLLAQQDGNCDQTLRNNGTYTSKDVEFILCDTTNGTVLGPPWPASYCKDTYYTPNGLTSYTCITDTGEGDSSANCNPSTSPLTVEIDTATPTCKPGTLGASPTCQNWVSGTPSVTQVETDETISC